jgi:hypothetical protein
MRAPWLPTLAVTGLVLLVFPGCSPRAESASAKEGTGAGAAATTSGVTSAPVAQMAKFDYGTQQEAQPGQLLWHNAATGAPAATPEYACNTDHVVAIDSTASFQSEEAGKCPDGHAYYKFTWQ